MTEPVRVRPGRPADIAGALAAWETALAARRGRPVQPEQRERTWGHLGKPDAFLVVADAAGRIVGMAVGLQALDDDGTGPPVPGHCHISAVFVEPERWGVGIGGRLLDALLPAAVARGYRSAQLWTQADNERALRLYASRGFTRTGRSMTLDGELIVHLAIEL